MNVKKIKVKLAEIEEIPFNLHTEFIKLDSLLKAVSAVNTGGHAKIIISEGKIKVNGEICFQRGKKIKAGDFVDVGLKRYIITKNDS